MINYNNKIIFFLYYFFLISFLGITNNYFTFENSLIFGGADGQSYMAISESFPKITAEKIQPIHSERFFFYYIFGFFSKISNIEIYNIYRLFVILIIGLINILLILILKKKKLEISLILIFLTLINLNPYISRFYIAVPTIINDLIFIFGITLLIYSLESNKYVFLILSLIILFFSRQTSIAVIVSLILTKLIYKQNFIIKTKTILIAITLFFIIYLINFNYSSHTFEMENFRWEQYSIETRLFGFLREDTLLKQKFIFLLLPFLSYLPLIAFFIIFFKFRNLRLIFFNNSNIFFYSIIATLILAQPVLSGVYITGKNIIRLTTLSYILILIVLFNFMIKDKIIKLSSLILFYCFIIGWSLHPTFSKIEFFEFFAKKININFYK